MVVLTESRARSMLPLASVSALTGVATALTGPFMSLFLTKEIGTSPFALGAFLLTTQLASLVASTLLGRFSDTRAVRRTLLVVGAVAGCGGYALFAVLRSYWLLLVVSLTLTAVTASLMPQMFAYAREVLERNGSARAPLFISGLRMLISVSWVAGPPLAALLVAQVGFVGLYAVSAGIYALVAAVALLWLPSSAAPRPVSPGAETGRGGMRAEVVLAALAFVFLQGAVSLGVQAMPLFVTDELGGTPGDAGLVLGLCAALEIPLMMGFGALAVRVDHRLLVCVGAVAALAYHGAMVLTAAIWQVAVAQVLHAVVISAAMGVGITYFQDLEPDRPGHATTLFTNTGMVSAMLSGPLLGVAQQLGYRTAYATCLALSAVGLVLLLFARPRRA